MSRDSLSLQGLRVLVVDDNVDTRELIVFILEEYGATVSAVASATEALSIFTQEPPDVLLSDIGMPEMDGYMLIREVRSLSPAQGGSVTAIALTAYAGEINQQKILSAGFQQHIAKPVEPVELASAIAQLVAGNNAQQILLYSLLETQS